MQIHSSEKVTFKIHQKLPVILKCSFLSKVLLGCDVYKINIDLTYVLNFFFNTAKLWYMDRLFVEKLKTCDSI